MEVSKALGRRIIRHWVILVAARLIIFDDGRRSDPGTARSEAGLARSGSLRNLIAHALQIAFWVR